MARRLAVRHGVAALRCRGRVGVAQDIGDGFGGLHGQFCAYLMRIRCRDVIFGEVCKVVRLRCAGELVGLEGQGTRRGQA